MLGKKKMNEQTNKETNKKRERSKTEKKYLHSTATLIYSLLLLFLFTLFLYHYLSILFYLSNTHWSLICSVKAIK
jgi:hypothetical protein